MQIGICDDNKVHLQYLRSVLEREKVRFQISAIDEIEPHTLQEACSKEQLNYDVLIIDIEMGELNGIELAKIVNRKFPSCMVIFVSNYIGYAMDVYEADHVYFVLKTDLASRIPIALEKVSNIICQKNKQFLSVKYKSTYYKISMSNITHIESFGRYLTIHDTQNSYQCINTLREVEEKLTNEFVKCHKSFIVNLAHIHSFSSDICLLKTGAEVPVSYTYKNLFKKSFANYIAGHL